MTLFGQMMLYSNKNSCIRAKWFNSGKSGCIRVKVLYSGKPGYRWAKVVLFWQKLTYSGKVVLFGKVVVFGQKWLYSCESGCVRANLLYLVKDGSTRTK